MKSTSCAFQIIRIRNGSLACLWVLSNRFHCENVILLQRRVGELPSWTLEELSGVIEHLGLEGAWKQGGKEARAVYEGPDPSRPQYIINYEKSACWVQGKQAQAIDIRIRAARRQ